MKKDKIQIPPRMKSKLVQFQRRVWMVKFTEGLCAALFGLLLSYLIVFALDRFYDTSSWLRAALLLVGTVGMAIWFPLVCHKWIWGSRRLEQVAKLLKVKHPRLGDYLLGIIELVNHDGFDGSSEALTRAALEQADRETAEKNFCNDVPYPKHYRWAVIAGVPLVLAGLLFCVVPSAGSNALQRWLMPWTELERFTFAKLESVPEKIVVPFAEQVSLETQLAERSQWKPDTASAWIGNHQVQSKRNDGKYEFELPPFQTKGHVDLRVGDALERINIDPQPRPELQSLTAVVYLPDYLQRAEPVRTEVRGGGVSIVEGSSVRLEAEATRPLASANLDSNAVDIKGSSISTNAISLNESTTVRLVWKDELGLSAKSPLQLKLRSAKDKAPSLVCRELEKKRVMMVKDVLSFQIDASDDFGVKKVGIEWAGEPAPTSSATPANGEKLVSAGNPNALEIANVVTTFSPKREKIEPQTIELKLFAEDYLPSRPRVYSQPYTVYVLSEDEHAIWMTDRLNDWFKKGLETYEREQQLYKRNIELRNLTPEELDRSEARRQIESQATAERSQARRLKSLTKSGEKLIQEAARNDQFGVDHLETLAQMLERLKEIHEQRMPSVADLLNKAAQAAAQPQRANPPSESQNLNDKNSLGNTSKDGKPQQGGKTKSENAESPAVTSVNDSPDLPSDDDKPQNKGEGKNDDGGNKDPAPSVSMRETTMDEKEKSEEDSENADSSPSKPSQLRLPGVVLYDPAKKDAGACPAAKQMDVAVESQEELLAEFQEIAEELQKLISNLEGSTFVKRLKAMSRRELVVAKDVTETSLQGFGEAKNVLKKASLERTNLIAKRQRAHAETLQNIQDDLDAYASRVQQGKFKTVLAEMRSLKAIEQISTVAKRMEANEPGTSIAQAELLADTFDRWAEQLVGPG